MVHWYYFDSISIASMDLSDLVLCPSKSNRLDLLGFVLSLLSEWNPGSSSPPPNICRYVGSKKFKTKGMWFYCFFTVAEHFCRAEFFESMTYIS